MQESISTESVINKEGDVEQLEQAEQEQQQSSSVDGLGGVDLTDLTELVMELGKGAKDIVGSIFDNIDLNF
ncbi:hypothetical protein [Acinetobacter sp. Marseille-Q1618]|uniref:hypothetical protein n=1 Tax=Acinetobacter sp. Marseille-Q1618 TaxID=2697502 RepID=UPI00156FAF53|nr:hypothetical protein [Acinetobacter sp. Marseille-Q1618]